MTTTQIVDVQAELARDLAGRKVDEVLEVADQDFFDVLELGHAPLLLDGEDLPRGQVRHYPGAPHTSARLSTASRRSSSPICP